MKTYVLLALAVAFCLAVWLALSLTPSGKATLEVQLVLAENDPDAAETTRLMVGFVPEGKSSAPTLGNIKIIEADPNGKNHYIVPALKSIGIFVIRSGFDTVTEIVTLESDQTLKHPIILPVTP